jgi:polyisoprenoid-binding protein YceI
MKTVLIPIALVGLIGLSAFTAATSTNTAMSVADGYAVKFTSKDPSGVFEKMKGTVVFNEQDLAAASFNVSIDVASINCGNGMQNRHARSAKWFDAEQYPEITFVSTGAKRTATGYETSGKLTMHGVTKDLTIPFTYTPSGTGGVFAGTFEVSRSAFGVGEPSKKVSDVLKVDVTVPVKH